MNLIRENKSKQTLHFDETKSKFQKSTFYGILPIDYATYATLQHRSTPCVSGKTDPATLFGRWSFGDNDVSSAIVIAPSIKV